jgi:hypothetical protein
MLPFFIISLSFQASKHKFKYLVIFQIGSDNS